MKNLYLTYKSYVFYMGGRFMYISYDYYRIFYYVAKYKNISQAAKLLLNNQPNITRTIKNLEGALGCTLFVRNRHGVSLTPEGERLYAHVKIAFEHLEAGEEEISLDKTLQRGVVSVGATEIALHCLLLPILKQYRTLYPNVKINISNHSTPQATAALKNGLLDFALVTTPTTELPSIFERPVKRIEEVAVCSAAYGKLTDKPITLEQLHEYPIISLSPATKTYEWYASFFNERGLRFSPNIEAATTDQILLMVKADLGISFIPEEMIRNELEIRTIRLKEEIPPRHICLLKRKDHSLSIAAKKMEEMILEKIDL